MTYNSKIKTSAFVLIITLVFAGIAYSQAMDDMKVVVTSGIGVTAEKARINALKNAIEQVIGSYVTAETRIKNDELIKDEILQYSAGYVKKHEILSKNQDEDGLWEVNIRASVISTKLKMKIEKMNLSVKKIDGGSLFGEAITKIEERKDAWTLMNGILDKYPKATYNLTIGKPQIIEVNGESEKANVRIGITIEFDQEWLGEFKNSIKQIAIKHTNKVKKGEPEIGIMFTDYVHAKNKNITDFFLIDHTIMTKISNAIFMKSGKGSPRDQHEDSLPQITLNFKGQDTLLKTISFRRGDAIDVFRDLFGASIKSSKVQLPYFPRRRLNRYTGDPSVYVYQNYGFIIRDRKSTPKHFLIWSDISQRMYVELWVKLDILKKTTSLEAFMSF